MKGLMARLLLPCEKASELVIKQEENKLTYTEKLQLKFHRTICGLCEEFENQNNFININLKKHYSNGHNSIKMTDDEKQKLKEALAENEK